MSVAIFDPTIKGAKALKILARALDPGCQDGEAETSAVMFVRNCRRERLGLPDLVKALAIVPIHPPVTTVVNDDPPACRIHMPFGKHRGYPLGWIAEHQPGYIVWGIDNLKDREIICAMLGVAEYYGIGPFEVTE